MRIIFLYILTFVLFYCISCNNRNSELSINEPKFKATDTSWCVPIESVNGSYSLVKYIRYNNTIIDLAFLNSKQNVLTSEVYSFNEDEILYYYIVIDRNSKNRYKVQYSEEKKITNIYGNINTFLDSIAYSENGGHTLFYTYPRIPYFKIKAVFYTYDKNENLDSIVPILKNNCHLLLKVGERLPSYIFPVFEYEHLITKNKFKLGWPSKLDTVKKVSYPKQLDLFYTKEIDYNEYPFVKED